jgi:hypothetical protein
MAADIERYMKQLGPVLTETVDSWPPSWTRGLLTITCDGQRIDYKITNPTSPDKAELGDGIGAACENLYFAMADDGHAWSEARIMVENTDEGLGYEADFAYAPGMTSPPRPKAKRPWWKIFG